MSRLDGPHAHCHTCGRPVPGEEDHDAVVPCSLHGFLAPGFRVGATWGWNPIYVEPRGTFRVTEVGTLRITFTEGGQ